MRTAPASVCLLIAALAAGTAACEKEQETPRAPSGGQTTAPAPTHVDDHHAGPVIDLGTATIGPFAAKATRDDGKIVAGEDAPIDVTVTPPADGSVKVAAVRFWIGTEDAQNSVKARAEVENPAEPTRWHTHAEIPDPIPAGAKLWVEIEDDKRATSVGSFDLKM